MILRHGNIPVTGDKPVFTDGTTASPVTLDTTAKALVVPDNTIAVNVVCGSAFQLADSADFDAGSISVPANTVVRIASKSPLYVKAASGTPALSFWFDTVEV